MPKNSLSGCIYPCNKGGSFSSPFFSPPNHLLLSPSIISPKKRKRPHSVRARTRERKSTFWRIDSMCFLTIEEGEPPANRLSTLHSERRPRSAGRLARAGLNCLISDRRFLNLSTPSRINIHLPNVFLRASEEGPRRNALRQPYQIRFRLLAEDHQSVFADGSYLDRRFS